MPFFFSCSYSCCVLAWWLSKPFPSLSDCVFVILVSSVVASCSGKIQSVAVVKNCLLRVFFSCSGVDEREVYLLVFLLSVGVVIFIFQNFFAYVCLCFNLYHFLFFWWGVVGSPVSFLLQVGEDELLVFVGQLDVVLQLICDVSLFSEDSLCLV